MLDSGGDFMAKTYEFDENELKMLLVAVRQMRRPIGLVSFTLADQATAERFLAALHIVAVATSFGGLHSSAERRARWGGDDVAPGFIRFSCGGEDTADLLADVSQALGAAFS